MEINFITLKIRRTQIMGIIEMTVEDCGFLARRAGFFLDEKGSPEGVNDISIKAVCMLAYKQN
jgi:hypothetical protein